MKKSKGFALILLVQLLCSPLFAQLPPGAGGGCTNCPPPNYPSLTYVPGLKLAIPLPSGTNLFLNLLEADPAGQYDIYYSTDLVSGAWSDVQQGTNGQTNFVLTMLQSDDGFFKTARTDTPVVNTAGMTVNFPNNYVNMNLISAVVSGGPAAAMAVLVNDTNLADAVWIPFSAVPYVLLGTNDGTYQVEFGFIGSDGQTNWTSASVSLDTTPPPLVITSPTNNVVTQPVIQLTGYSPEALASISYDITNASGLATNQQVLVLDQFYDTNVWKFTTNTFQAFDILLTNGLNVITLHATDLAGNSTTLTTNFALDYSSKTNPPVVQLNWPQNGIKVCGNIFTCNGSVSDPTATITVQLVDTNGDINIVNAAVDRDGNFWAEDLPLSSGTNYLTVTTTDAANNTATNSLIVIQGDIGLAIDLVSSGQTLVTGEINSSDYTIWVNGSQATNNGDGTWTAQIASIGVGGGIVEAMAIPNSDNGGNGSGGSDSSGNPNAVSAKAQSGKTFAAQDSSNNSSSPQGVQTVVNAPEGVYISSYRKNDMEDYTDPYTGPRWWFAYTDFSSTSWVDGKGGNGTLQFHDGLGVFRTYFWPATSWPQPLPSGIGIEIDLGFPPIPPSPPSTGPCGPPSLVKEHCKIHQIVPDEDVGVWNGYQYDVTEHFQRTADTQMKLATGGKAGSKRMNLWAISASATAYLPPWLNYPLATVPIARQNISIMGKQLNSNGIVYVVLPDNSKPDVTPVVTGPNTAYYTFSVSATKYLSHFTVYVDMPDPPPGRNLHDGDDYGHAWWQFTTDAPNDAVHKFIPPTTAYFLGKEVGYYPIGTVAWYNLGIVDGTLHVPETDSNKTVTKSYDVGFPNLISGLDYTKQLYISPGKWDPLLHNCVHAAWFAGADAGVFLSPSSYPEEFGYEIQGIPY